MNKYFLAIAAKGSEFLYRKSTMIAVPTKSARSIMEALNKTGYKLKAGEVWHIYENDTYNNDFISEQIKSYSPNKNIKVYRYHG